MPAEPSVGIETLRRFAQVGIDRVLGRSDYARWSDQQSLEDWWESRTVEMARLVPPRSRVIEFGAGKRRLAAHLDATSTYFASDLVARDAETIVCDLNRRPLPDLSDLAPDVAFFAGVLEYVVSLPELAEWLAGQVGACVVSYDALREPRWSLRGARERLRRRYFGYMNAYDADGLVAVFARAGFRPRRLTRWQSQVLLLLGR